MLELNRIYHMDCMEGVRLLPDKSADMILCDLPYGITGNRSTWDKVLPIEPLWSEYKRIIKDDGAIVLTAVNPFASLLVASNLEMYKYEWIWEKDQGSNFATVNFQPFRVHEQILVFSRGKITYTPKGGYMKYNPQKTKGDPYKMKRGGMTENLAAGKGYERTDGEYDGWRHPRTVLKFKRETGLHPTQKPVDLFRLLIRTYTNPGDIVLDNCMGSGTTAVAATHEGRNWIGFETEEKYVEIANRRLEAII